MTSSVNTAAPKLLGADGKELKVNGHARPALVEAFLQQLNERRQSRRAKLTYDAARDSQEYARHWANADALDADSANNYDVRRKLYHRSRYENGSNGYYNGILRTHTNMVVGTGPRLRMTTQNANFNELVEREFNEWAEEIGLRRKLWCLAHARYQDGEAFAVVQTNMGLRNRVKIDITPIECDQVHTPIVPMERGYIDGIKYDVETGEVLWYDVLRDHPGSTNNFLAMTQDPIRIPPSQMLHWFKLERPGEHRGVPAMHSSLSVGANSRRMREAVLAAHETGADFSVLLKTGTNPTATGTMNPMSAAEIEKRMMVTLPDGYDAFQLKSEYPSATYPDFNRLQIAETGRPISQPVNAAMCDSSTYSFASGKLDTICYRFEINGERADCEALFLNRIFAIWFREWRLVAEPDDMGPSHQWDWPAHPVIDAEAEAGATDIELKNGSTTLSDAVSAKGEDYENLLLKQAQDWFGDRTDANVAKCRQINLLRNVPKEALPYVAQIIGLAPVAAQPSETTENVAA